MPQVDDKKQMEVLIVANCREIRNKSDLIIFIISMNKSRSLTYFLYSCDTDFPFKVDQHVTLLLMWIFVYIRVAKIFLLGPIGLLTKVIWLALMYTRVAKTSILGPMDF